MLTIQYADYLDMIGKCHYKKQYGVWQMLVSSLDTLSFKIKS